MLRASWLQQQRWKFICFHEVCPEEEEDKLQICVPLLFGWMPRPAEASLECPAAGIRFHEGRAEGVSAPAHTIKI